MKLDQAINIEDLHRIAKRKLPKIIFDFIEGGLEDERGLERNRAAFQKHQLLPRYLVDVSVRDQAATLFGHTYSSPFGISPTGGAGLYRRNGDLLLAEAAAEANIPFIMSGGSNASMEEAMRVAPDNTWYQLYAAKDGNLSDALIGRARDCGVGALVLTVDVPIHPKRERNWRNGFASVRNGGVMEALKLKPSILLEAMTHPAWVIDYVRHGGAPTLGNWAPHAGNGASKADAIRLGRTQTPAAAQTWRDLERYRRLFPRPLVVKGILSPADAVRAAEIGVDGIIVSNHGGRQLDQAPASLDALPAIKAAVGDKVTVMLDSGVRRGADILIARCLGAQFVFFGRPTLYGAVAGGGAGVKKAVDIFRTEIDLVMAQIGCPSLAELGPDFLWRDDWTQNR
ncbi:MAG TPA: alpha-hydroxy acid oxidase [Stellaceae bacterium]|jgi:L-lactate dehydrogenase (cytochrome)/(S)-mandelate dehydrogenase|nr:alpha-hydroxy acid oxidase [Stellaceae bacterium]